MLTATVEQPTGRLRVLVSTIGRPLEMDKSKCQRTRLGDGRVQELVYLLSLNRLLYATELSRERIALLFKATSACVKLLFSMIP